VTAQEGAHLGRAVSIHADHGLVSPSGARSAWPSQKECQSASGVLPAAGAGRRFIPAARVPAGVQI
jgi:hypothetical protein